MAAPLADKPPVDSDVVDQLVRHLADPAAGRPVIEKALRFAQHFHENQFRKSGEPYIAHPIAVAQLVADLRLDESCIAAALMHDLLEDTHLTSAELEAEFPAPIPALVQGVTKISKFQYDVGRHKQIENIRKMFIAMARDIGVVLLKLCDRLHNLRTLDALPPERQRAIARETLDLYAHLANRLGMTRVKMELEDLSMRYLYPAEYDEIRGKVRAKRAEREQRVQHAIREIQSHLATNGHQEVKVTGRSKHFYSIFRKMREQGLDFDGIHDLTAVRIICEKPEDCYAIFGVLTTRWPSKPERFKDYISNPKPNGYQSLHLVISGPGGNDIEVQIRTREMHRVAEYGIAAHWKYKEGRIEPGADKRLDWVAELEDWAKESGDPDALMRQAKKEFFTDSVLCFTPNNDVVHLPLNATPIDFAYSIHTKVGDSCVGAKVNRRIVSLRHKLKHGDHVEILTSPSGHPSRDWLDVAKTHRAKVKIRRWLKSKEMERWVVSGRNALNALIKERNLEITRAELDAHLETLLQPFRMKTVDDVLAEIGFGTISAQAALARMNPEWAKPRRKPRASSAAPAAKRVGAVLVDGLEGLTIRFANCCGPIPGDPIIAFVTRGRGVSVHKAGCANLARQRLNEENEGRILEARWNTDRPVAHTVRIRIEAKDRKALLADISNVVTRTDAYIESSRSETDRQAKIAYLYFDIDIVHTSQLDQIVTQLREVKDVYKVERLSR